MRYVEALRPRPMPPARLETPLYVDGRAEAGSGGDTFPRVHPATGATIGAVALATRADVERAVEAARRALHGPWGRLQTEDRLRLLERVAQRIDERAAEFVDAEVWDTGKPITFARHVDVPRGAANFRVFASIVRASGTSAFATDTPDGRGALNYTLRTPVGVVAVICPWNLPLLLMTWKVAPALALGNTVVVKPSEETPASATLLADVMREVGVPPGVYNVVHGFGPGSTGAWLTEAEGVDAITFTGESRTGATIMRAAADRVRAVSFELGGKNAAIVFDDADLEAAVDGTTRSVFANCGQVCLCSERVYVQRGVYDRFVGALAARADAMRLGDPFDPETEMGPLISAAHRDKVAQAVERAAASGGAVVAGATPRPLAAPFASGSYFPPTIIAGLSDRDAFVRDEVFGPVCHIAPFDTEDEVVARANDSTYGLCAAVWTGSVTRAHRIAARLEVGMVWINAWFLRDLRTPFGGMKLSGLGREGGAHSLDFYSELKNVCVKL